MKRNILSIALLITILSFSVFAVTSNNADGGTEVKNLIKQAVRQNVCIVDFRAMYGLGAQRGGVSIYVNSDESLVTTSETEASRVVFPVATQFNEAWVLRVIDTTVSPPFSASNDVFYCLTPGYYKWDFNLLYNYTE